MKKSVRLCAGLMAVVLAVAAANAQSVESLMSSGMELLRNGAYSQAIATFRKVLQQDPGQFEAQHNVAFSYLQMGRYPDAVREFKRAIQMNGRNAETWANLAFAYESMNKSGEAIEALYQSVNLDPGNVTARLNLATMYVNEGKHTQAIAQYKQIIQMDGSNVEAYTNLAKCLINAKKHSEAVVYLKQAIDNDPGNSEAHWELGNIYLDKEKDAKKAIAEYKIAVSLTSDQPKYYTSLADAHLAANDKEAAIETLHKSMVYIVDALAKERVQRRVDQLEGKTTASGVAGPGGSAGPVVDTKGQMEELQKDLRSSERKETKTVETKPLDISSDFDDLNNQQTEELDLTKEAKKRAK
jgi:tetratricopeptide (TPR) repeat protein